MPISFDTAAAERSGEARELFAALDSGTDEPVVLTMLSGVDLCILGAMSWEALATSWNRLKPEDRSKITEARATQMIERGLLIEQSPGQGYDPLAYYAVSAKLGIALAARLNPTFIVTSAVSPKQAPLTLFAVGDATAPVRGIVVEVPSLTTGKDKGNPAPEPLSLQFNPPARYPGLRCGVPSRVDAQERTVKRLPQEDSTHGGPVPPPAQAPDRQRSYRSSATGRLRA